MKPTRLLLALAVGSLACSGCVNARYKSAGSDIAPPAVLNLTAEQPLVAVTLHSVIASHGPGSWKRDAYWDEYVVSLANRSATPLRFEAATLSDSTDASSEPGDNPWLLEQQSLTLEQEIKTGARNVLAQTGGGYVGIFAIGGGVAGAAGAVVALPVYIAGNVYANVHSRHRIEAEFARRRLTLPVTLAPGETVQGSLFFRITPGPRELALLYQNDGPLQWAVVDLAPLTGPHLPSATSLATLTPLP